MLIIAVLIILTNQKRLTGKLVVESPCAEKTICGSIEC